MSEKSHQVVEAALEALKDRYNHDLAYLMKRLDRMDQTIYEQNLLLRRLGLALFDWRDKREETSNEFEELAVEERDEC